MAPHFKRLRNESGQALIEYMLVLLFAMGMATVLAKISKQAWDKGVLGFGGNLELSLKTGMLPASAWKN